MQRTSAAVSQLFDPKLRALRRDRAARLGPELFVYERAFEDILERLSEVRRTFTRALLIGTPAPFWPERLRNLGMQVQAVEAGALFARAAGALHTDEEEAALTPGNFDLCIAIGTLDTIDDLPTMLLRIRAWLASDGLLLGVIPGGDTLPQLRAAMRAADAVAGSAAPHVHPRIEASALAGLLGTAGFALPVVDVDRVRVSYRTLASLVADLRRMAATNLLLARPRLGASRSAYAAAEAHFQAAGDGSRTVETFELLHFAGWAPQQG